MKKRHVRQALWIGLPLVLGVSMLCPPGFPSAVAAEPPAYGTDAVTPVLGAVTVEPFPAVLSDGTARVTYELVVSNACSVEFSLERLDVVDPGRSDTIIKSFGKDGLVSILVIPGAKGPTNILQPTQSAFLRIDLNFPHRKSVPRSLGHLLTVTTSKPSPPNIASETKERVGITRVGSQAAPVIGAPLRGDRWVAANVGADSAHRKAVMPLNGRWIVAQRWAVDYLRMDAQNRIVTGDEARNESYPQYREKIYAVADGIILEVNDGLPDGTPPKAPPNPSVATAGGNYVLQDIGNGYAAFYAHLIPGSLKVKKGDRVRKAQVLGHLGNSGNSTAPHLHFHVVKGKTALGADGVPYVFDAFRLQGYIDAKARMDADAKSPRAPVKILPGKPETRRRQMPADMAVVAF